MPEIPQTVGECDSPDCDEELNVLAPHLTVAVKPKMNVLLVQDTTTEDPNEIPVGEILLGTKSGRGVMLRFHDFDCACDWFKDREGKPAKLEYHHEDEIYKPEDNRSPEELVEAGELPEEFLALAEARADAEDGDE